ncbi:MULTISPECIES: signal peptidase I [Micrococcaceae]|uniref:signal peptidase I n=1 Tax=unclassified Kocuria TaxID=2649579 RepID=UPI0035301B70
MTNPSQAVATAADSKRRLPWGSRRLVVVALVIAVLIMVLVRGLLLEVFYIPSASMEPTLQEHDRVAVWRPGSNHPNRGDIVVFDGTGSLAPYDSGANKLTDTIGEIGSWLGVGTRQGVYVKRVIGVPGDHVHCCAADGRITVNGQPKDEPYIMQGDAPSGTRFDVVVPEGRMWVMGDHRSDSNDSRSLIAAPGGGLIKTDKIIGRPVAVIWPLNRISQIDR